MVRLILLLRLLFVFNTPYSRSTFVGGREYNTMNKINEIILDGIDLQEIIYKSRDRTSDEADALQFPIEFLESIEDAGLPTHELKLKVCVPIILIRNIQPPQLCNGTRSIVTALGKTVVQAIILTGVSTGEIVFISRIPFASANLSVRLQFPIKLCFSLTINKSQGETYQRVDVCLKEQCFSHE